MEPAGLDLGFEMVVVVYCYLLLTVHQVPPSVREGVIRNQSLPPYIRVGPLPFYALFYLAGSPAGYLKKKTISII